MNEQEKKYDLFISYAWDDMQIVDEIQTFIERYIPSIKIFRDKSEGKQAEKLFDQLEDNIKDSQCLLCMHSVNLLCSANCYREWKWAEKHNIQRYPVILPPGDLAKGYVQVEKGDLLYCVWKEEGARKQFIEAISRITHKPIGRKTFNVNDIQFDMILVTSGTSNPIRFDMGSKNSNANIDEQPIHTEVFGEYYLGETTVTQALWYAVMHDEKPAEEDMEKPKVNIDFGECRKFLRNLKDLTGVEFRFPFENEWEFAARGGNEGIQSGDYNNDVGVWNKENSNRQLQLAKGEDTHRNALGLYNMLGNVWEWCKNRYYVYPEGTSEHPKQVPDTGSNEERITRGGSYLTPEHYCTVSNRRPKHPSEKDIVTGLRLALSSTQKQ